MPKITISKEEQQKIVETIKSLCTSGEGYDREREHTLFTGVYIALGSNLPVDWIINIQVGRTDRIMKS